jgi:hypothetical protein
MKLIKARIYRHPCAKVQPEQSPHRCQYFITSVLKNPSFSTDIQSKLSQATLAAALTLTLITASPLHSLASTDVAIPSPQSQQDTSFTVDDAHPIIDIAKVIPRDKFIPLTNQLIAIEKDTGYRLRVYTNYRDNNAQQTISREDLRSGWKTEQPNTIVVLVDPSAPNILQFKYSRGVERKLPRQFFSELSSRFGNVFNIRETGEAAAVTETIDALTTCLRREEGCRVVPGLANDEYYFTLGASIAGGIVAGAAFRIQPQGWVKQSYVWALLFSPLWFVLFFSFGIGPVVTRTSDVMPVVGNCLGFLGAVGLVVYQREIAQGVRLLPPDKKDDDDDDYNYYSD